MGDLSTMFDERKLDLGAYLFKIIIQSNSDVALKPSLDGNRVIQGWGSNKHPILSYNIVCPCKLLDMFVVKWLKIIWKMNLYLYLVINEIDIGKQVNDTFGFCFEMLE